MKFPWKETSDEERQANWKKLCEDVDDFCKEWNVTIKI